MKCVWVKGVISVEMFVSEGLQRGDQLVVRINGLLTGATVVAPANGSEVTVRILVDDSYRRITIGNRSIVRMTHRPSS